MEISHHNMKEYTTIEAAQLVGVSPTRIRQLAKEELIEHKKFGRTLVITEDGIKQAKARNTKPGPQPDGDKAE